MPPSTDCGVDTAAYVLGALDAHEVDAFERHLRTCSVCETEVESLRHTVNLLPMAAPQHLATRDLRRRVMRSVRADSHPERQTSASNRVGGLGFGRGSVPRFAPAAGFRPGLVYGMTAVVLVVVVVAVGLLASSSGSRSGQVVDASIGQAKVIDQKGHGELIVHHLSHLSGGQVYEVWLEHPGGKPLPTPTTFNTSSKGDADVTVSESLNGESKLLVTREQHGGAVHPSKHLVIVVPNLS